MEYKETTKFGISALELSRDKSGNITSEASAYKPGDEALARIKEIKGGFDICLEARDKPYREFGNVTLMQKVNECQRNFNAYVEDDLPAEEQWRSEAFRPAARNKVISFAAHLTGTLMFPQIFAQNRNQQEDKDAAEFMRDAIEWAADQSRYDKTFLYAIVSALVNPIVYIHQEYANVHRVVKEMKEDGSWKKKEVRDDLFSGFINSIVPLEEMYIPNYYEENIQRQPFIIRRRVLDYSVIKKKYAGNDNLKYVKPGAVTFYDEDTEKFYQEYDSEWEDRRGVEEIIYWNRTGDLKLVLLNGVLINDPEQPNPRKDKTYPFAKTGFEIISDNFFFYRSLVDKVGPDQDIINDLYRLVIDGSFLRVMPPGALYGGDEITSSVIKPGAVTEFQSPESKFEAIDVGSDLGGGMTVLEKVENSLSESSSPPHRSGQVPEGSQTAYELARAEENAKVLLGLAGKMIGFLVRDWGELMVGDILQHMTVGQIDEVTGDLSYKSIILPDKMENGKKKTKMYRFNPQMANDERDVLDKSLELMKESGGIDSDSSICEVNPQMVRDRDYLIRVSPDSVTQPSEALQRVFKLELYDRAIQNPHGDQRALYQDLLLGSYEPTKSDVDKYTIDEQQLMQSQQGAGGLSDLSQGLMRGETGKKGLKELVGQAL